MIRSHKLLTIVIVGLILLTTALASWHTYAEWHREYFFGKITQIDNSSLVIETPDKRQTTILTQPQTMIKKGRDPQPAILQTGELIMVFGTMNTLGQVEARLIRTIQPPRP